MAEENQPVLGLDSPRTRSRRAQTYGSLTMMIETDRSDGMNTAENKARRGPTASMNFDRLGIKKSFATLRRRATQVSHEFNRLRKRTNRRAQGPDKAGDFQIVDLINENFRSYTRGINQTTTSNTLILRLYLLLTMMAMFTGFIATLLDFTVEWLSGLKNGICWTAPYLTMDACCEGSKSFEVCDNFVPWSALLHVPYVSHSTVNFFVYLGFALMFAGCAARLVKSLAPYAAGSGIPEVKTILSGVNMAGFLSGWTLLIKVIGLTLSVASSLNLGKEGPFVHLSSCLGYVLNTRFKLLERNGTFLREILCCCCAAGVSVAFGAPIGGVLFVFEEASSYFPHHVLWRCFYASTVAALTLRTINPFFNGKTVMYEVDYLVPWYWFEMIPFAVIGIIGGIIGGFFIQFNVMWSKFRLHSDIIRRNPVNEALLVVLATVLLSYPVGVLRTSNSSILAALLNNCSIKAQNELLPGAQEDYELLCNPNNYWTLVGTLMYATISKFILTVFTFGLRVPAGLFVPSLTIGACVGRLFGAAMDRLYSSYSHWFVFAECSATSICIEPGLYAIIGAGAVLAGVTQVSVSITVIIFELTGGLRHLLPTMVAILFAKVVASQFGIPSIYDSHVLLKRYPCLEQDVALEHDVPCRRVMRKMLRLTTEAGETVASLGNMLREENFYCFPIVDNGIEKNLVGNIVRPELETALQKAQEIDWVKPETRVIFDIGDQDNFELLEEPKSLNFGLFMDYFCPSVLSSTPVSQIYQMFASMGIRHVLVIENGQLVGVVSKKDLLAFVDVTEGVPKKFFL